MPSRRLPNRRPAERGDPTRNTVPRRQGAGGSDLTLAAALPVWAYVALNSFGGPAGQIAVMHRVLVDTRRWISEQRFLHALNFCMLLPGPEAHQLAVYIGWLLHGVRGGLVAGLLFILPGFVAILALSLLYAHHQDTAAVQAVFYGLKPAVVAVVAAAVLRVGRRAIRGRLAAVIAASSFAALFFLDVPFPVVIGAAGAVGLAASRLVARAVPAAGHGGDPRPLTETTRPLLDDAASSRDRPSGQRSGAVGVLGAALWLAPVVLLVALLGPANVFATQAVFFSGAAVVTFGGAYAVLSYVAQQVVEVLGWLSPTEMLDGLGLAETTPGPLIMVVEFVGFLAAFRNPGGLDPTVAGLFGAVLVTWVTFVPSFLWIFVGAPYAEHLRGSARLSAALSAITAAVVGAILNLALWFGLHALFGVVAATEVGPVTVSAPDPRTIDLVASAIAIGAAVAVFGRQWPVLAVLAAGAVAGVVAHAVGLAPTGVGG